MVEFTAHRGESRDAPENTMSAFRLAWVRGIRSVELDVHLSRDGVLVVHHDPDTERMTGENRIIRDLNYADLADLDTGWGKGESFVGERIARLEDVLIAMPGEGRLLVEIKSGPESVEPLRLAMERAGAGPGRVQVICFETDVLVEVRSRLPGLRVQFLAEYTDEVARDWRSHLAGWVETAREAGFHGLGLDRRIPLDVGAVESVRRNGLHLHVWTVDDPDRARELVGVGVESITSNRAAWLRDRVAD